jgi:hypothetical protein
VVEDRAPEPGAATAERDTEAVTAAATKATGGLNTPAAATAEPATGPFPTAATKTTARPLRPAPAYAAPAATNARKTTIAPMTIVATDASTEASASAIPSGCVAAESESGASELSKPAPATARAG